MDEHIRTLETIEAAVSKGVEGLAQLRKRADDVYDDRVEQLAKEHGVSADAAHAMAARDAVAGRAYAISVDLAERERRSRASGLGLAAHYG